MLKASEILLETIKKDGRPERLLRQYEGATFYPRTRQIIMCVETVTVVWSL